MYCHLAGITDTSHHRSKKYLFFIFEKWNSRKIEEMREAHLFYQIVDEMCYCRQWGVGSSDLFTHQINKSTTQHFRVPAFVYFFAYIKASGAVTFSRRPMRADDLQFPLSTISSFSICLPLRLATSLVTASRTSLLYDSRIRSPSSLLAQHRLHPSVLFQYASSILNEHTYQYKNKTKKIYERSTSGKFFLSPNF